MKRTPQNTNWDCLKKKLRVRLRKLLTKYGTIKELKLSEEHLPRDPLTSNKNNCPPITVGSGRGAQWWNKHLEALMTTTRKLYNRAQKTKKAADFCGKQKIFSKRLFFIRSYQKT